MADILTFALVAPMGSMGSLAVGERRGSWDHPARSAILGLIAGCLGIERSEEDAHVELSAGLGLAIRRTGRATSALSDYHTAQTRPSRRNQVFLTRKEEMADKQVLETVLSRRDYRTDTAFTVAIWRREAAMRWSFDDLVQAMRSPAFVPYLGRKSCPLSLPMDPMVITAETLHAAFIQRDAKARRPEQEAVRPGEEWTIWADVPRLSCPELGVAHDHIDQRRDEVESRQRWQFGLRTEITAHWKPAGERR